MKQGETNKNKWGTEDQAALSENATFSLQDEMDAIENDLKVSSNVKN